MREIVLDTETTGLDPSEGHKMVEIAALEIVNLLPTGNTFHTYLNPQRDMPMEAERVHGLSTKFLADKPLFRDRVADFIDFIAGDALVIHNAAFDLKFLNHEIKGLNKPALKNPIVDTLKLAKQKLPGQRASLDALCRYYNISLENRTLHGALIDCELLAEVYLELRGGRQPDLVLGQHEASKTTTQQSKPEIVWQNRTFTVPEEERAAHQAFLKEIKDPIWNNYSCFST